MVPSPADGRDRGTRRSSSVAPLLGNWARKASQAVARNSASFRMSASGTETSSSSSAAAGGSSSTRKTPDSQRKTSSSVSRILMASDLAEDARLHQPHHGEHLAEPDPGLLLGAEGLGELLLVDVAEVDEQLPQELARVGGGGADRAALAQVDGLADRAALAGEGAGHRAAREELHQLGERHEGEAAGEAAHGAESPRKDPWRQGTGRCMTGGAWTPPSRKSPGKRGQGQARRHRRASRSSSSPAARLDGLAALGRGAAPGCAGPARRPSTSRRWRGRRPRRPSSAGPPDGKPFTLAEARGQVVFVNFWATWCPPCREEMPSMLQLGRELAARHPGKFRMVAVSVDDGWPEVLQFFGGPAARAASTCIRDPEQAVTREYYCLARGGCPDSFKFPETYVVDASGKLVSYVVGPRDWTDPAARRFLERLIP